MAKVINTPIERCVTVHKQFKRPDRCGKIENILITNYQNCERERKAC